MGEALKVALAECHKLTQELVSAEELSKIKDYARGKLAIGLETSYDLASFYADQELLKKEILSPEEKLARLDKVTAEDIMAVAKEIFMPEKLNLALIGPFKEDDGEIKKVLHSW